VDVTHRNVIVVRLLPGCPRSPLASCNDQAEAPVVLYFCEDGSTSWSLLDQRTIETSPGFDWSTLGGFEPSRRRVSLS